MKNTRKQVTMALLVAGLSLLPMHAAVPAPVSAEERMSHSIRKELLTMPFLTIFDNLAYRIDGNTVHLYGQVIRPTLKSQAAARVAKLEGIAHVDNQIEVLPLSPFDDRLRIAVARAVYGQPALNRYALGANPSIRIIVKNGNVTLEGVVNDTGARNIANIQANGVPGVFSVTNNLRVEK
ncbi:MAG: BON domain-containing protein [Acidobacteria bacterium]|nr:BON domain-containing protein [Acidobacteriota bacterium]